MFTYYLIKVAWGGDAPVCARVAINLSVAGLPNIMLWGCQNIGEVLLRNPSLLFLSCCAMSLN